VIDPSHTEYDLGTGEFAVAIETATPGPFERYFEEQNASTNRRTFAGDEHASVVAHYPGDRQGYLVVHDLSMEVDNG
jgi:monoamine oxidase